MTTILTQNKLIDKNTFQFTLLYGINTSYSLSLFPFITKQYKKLYLAYGMTGHFKRKETQHKGLEHVGIYAQTLTYTKI